MPASVLQCHRCQTALPSDPVALQAAGRCPLCGAETQVALFPAWNRTASAAPAAQPILESGESACFFHPQKRALAPCDRCGRFLCALCDFPIESGHWCAGCVEASTRTKELGSLERSRVRWDQLVWYLLLGPLVLGGWPAVVCAPAALVIAILKLNAPPSLVSHSRARLIGAMAFASLEIAAIGVLLYFVATH